MLINICKSRVFSIFDANDLLPIIKRIFAKHEAEITKALADQRFFISTFAPQDRVNECDRRVERELIQMGSKLTKLGLKTFGDGYIGFDNGYGYYSFRNGEQSVTHFHGYMIDPHVNRVKLPERYMDEAKGS